MQFNFLSLSNVQLPQLCLQVGVGLQLDQGLRDRGLERIGLRGASFDDLRTHLEHQKPQLHTPINFRGQVLDTTFEQIFFKISTQINTFTSTVHNADIIAQRLFEYISNLSLSATKTTLELEPRLSPENILEIITVNGKLWA